MSAARRQELLNWAVEKEGRYVIEDDYDCEFRYRSRSIPALKSMDRNGRVIYMNTFSKTLAPAIRISYMVLPEALISRYIDNANFYSNTASACEQYALARFIENGYFERHPDHPPVLPAPGSRCTGRRERNPFAGKAGYVSHRRTDS